MSPSATQADDEREPEAHGNGRRPSTTYGASVGVTQAASRAWGQPADLRGCSERGEVFLRE